MKKLALFTSIMLLASLSLNTFALEEGEVSSDGAKESSLNADYNSSRSNKARGAQDINNDIGESRNETKKVEMKENREEMKEELRREILNNRNKAKENRQNFRNENMQEILKVKSALSINQVEQLQELKENYLLASIELREDMKAAETNEERNLIREKIDALITQQFLKMNEILGEDVGNLLSQRQEIYTENEMLRQESRDIRSEYKAERKEYIDAYRDAFIQRIGDRLNNIPPANLEKAAGKIDELIERIENNARMNEQAKQVRLDAIIALKEIVEERIQADEGDEDIFGILEELITE